jgi:plastocyanin
MKKLTNGITLTAGALFAWLCCLPDPSAQAASYDISMTANGFVPSYLEVTVGDRVYWWNDDDYFFDDHSTHSYTYSWNSGPVPYGYGVYLDVLKTGTYSYTDDVGFSGSGTLVIKPGGPPPPTLIPAPNRVDMVYDQGRDIVYITSGNQVLRYQLGSDSFLSPFQLSGNLMGLDLSPDGNTLIVADSSANTNVWVHVVDLTSGQSRQAFFRAAFSESGTYAVAFGADGAALISSRFAGSGWVPLRRYDPVTGQTSTVSGSVRQDSMVSASADGSAIVFEESNISNGPFHKYDVASRTITRNATTGRFDFECAASRDASLFSVSTGSGGTLIYNSSFTQVTNFSTGVAAAFHPAADAVFLTIAGTTYVRAYDTTTWQMLGQFDFQNIFSNPSYYGFTNRIRLSPDGQIVFVTVSGGVRYLRHNLNLPLSHRLVVSGSPAPYGVPSPISYGTYWLADGTNLTISVPDFVATNGTEVICTGWTGTGSAAGTDTTTSATFTLSANSTLTFNWVPFAVSANVVPQAGGKQMVLQWPSLAGRTYDVLYSTSPVGGFAPIDADLPATPPNNSWQTALSGPAGFYKIRMK